MEKSNIHLVAFNPPKNLTWPYGEFLISENTVFSLATAIENLLDKGGFTIFWDFKKKDFNIDLFHVISTDRGDLWHSGKKAEFQMLKFIRPCWMLSLQSDIRQPSVSWKIDLTQLLILNDVFRQLGNICEKFETLEAAGLEFGYRCITQGVIPIYHPEMGEADKKNTTVHFSVKDEFVFLRRHFRSFWVNWATFRTIATKTFGFSAILKSWAHSNNITYLKPVYYTRKIVKSDSDFTPNISAILITLGRYQYLTKVIEQLLTQKLKPNEIIVVDATPTEKGIIDFKTFYPTSDVPIRYFHSDKIGQCSQRNFGIQKATGDYIFFMDDDMEEVQPDHLQRHWQNIINFKADVSSGVPDEKDALTIDRKNMCLTVSHVFPTNDSLVSLQALSRSGLFDERMDKGQSEDHELGIRLFKSGALMVLDPMIQSLHLRVPSGGLRTFGSRKITRSSARKKLLHRRLPHVTELYLQIKHFSHEEIRESVVISLWATLSFHGNRWLRLMKLVINMALLPDTIFKLKNKRSKARLLVEAGEIVPKLNKTQSNARY